MAKQKIYNFSQLDLRRKPHFSVIKLKDIFRSGDEYIMKVTFDQFRFNPNNRDDNFAVFKVYPNSSITRVTDENEIPAHPFSQDMRSAVMGQKDKANPFEYNFKTTLPSQFVEWITKYVRMPTFRLRSIGKNLYPDRVTEKYKTGVYIGANMNIYVVLNPMLPFGVTPKQFDNLFNKLVKMMESRTPGFARFLDVNYDQDNPIKDTTKIEEPEEDSEDSEETNTDSKESLKTKSKSKDKVEESTKFEFLNNTIKKKL